MPRLVLVLLRHGHAEGGTAPTDRARRLTERGRREARAVASRLGAAAWRPALALVSDARRTLETCSAIAEVLGDVPMEPRQELYLGGLADLKRVLAPGPSAAAGGEDAPPRPCQLLVVGHNPTLSELASLLTGDYVALGTAEAAVLAVEAANWGEAIEMDGAWELVAEVGPGHGGG